MTRRHGGHVSGWCARLRRRGDRSRLVLMVVTGPDDGGHQRHATRSTAPAARQASTDSAAEDGAAARESFTKAVVLPMALLGLVGRPVACAPVTDHGVDALPRHQIYTSRHPLGREQRGGGAILWASQAQTRAPYHHAMQSSRLYESLTLQDGKLSNQLGHAADGCATRPPFSSLTHNG